MDAKAKSKKAPATAEANASPDVKRGPVKTLRMEDVSASVWAREFVVQGTPTTFYSITFERSYKDRHGAWKYTRTFDPKSLATIVTLCQQASEYICGQQQDAA